MSGAAEVEFCEHGVAGGFGCSACTEKASRKGHTAMTDHVIGVIDDGGEIQYLGCRTCGGNCAVMTALHVGYNGYRTLARRGFNGIEMDQLDNVTEAYERMGELLYPDGGFR